MRQGQHNTERGATHILHMMLAAASAVRTRQGDVLAKLERKSDEVAIVRTAHHSVASSLGAFMDRALEAAQGELEEAQAEERARGEDAGIHPQEGGGKVLKRITQPKPGSKLGVKHLPG